MEARYRATGKREKGRVAIPLLAVCLLALLVIGAAERGVFTRHAAMNRIAIPGITVDDDDGVDGDTRTMPIVTSLRSNGEAERLGIRVGDHIAAVDGRPVRDVAGLRAAIVADRARGPVALHILRGSAVWNIALDRAEPPPGDDRATARGR